jgi:lipoprotein-anchoring transpeptidase ErfK/SrfK
MISHCKLWLLTLTAVATFSAASANAQYSASPAPDYRSAPAQGIYENAPSAILWDDDNYDGRPRHRQRTIRIAPQDDDPVDRQPYGYQSNWQPSGAAPNLPTDDTPEQPTSRELPANLKKQTVTVSTKEPAGTIIIDTQNTYLYLVLGNGTALRYGIGVGREGFTWSGAEHISQMRDWPDWYPPSEMIDRQPYLPRMMTGGQGNPLGARALYLGHTLYRIHGTNQPSTIGKFVSSGCIRLLNEDIEDLYSRVHVGTRVVVLPSGTASE